MFALALATRVASVLSAEQQTAGIATTMLWSLVFASGRVQGMRSQA